MAKSTDKQSSTSSKSEILVRHKKSKSLKMTIGLLYMVLAVVNIVFFSVMIFENQTDLLMNTFRYQSTNLVNDVLGNLQNIKVSREQDANYGILKSRLMKYELRYFIIFDKEGKVWHKHSSEEFQAPDEASKALMQKIGELSAEEAMFKSRYSMELNEKDYSIDLLIPIKSNVDSKIFLFSPLSISSMQKRLQDMYKQIAISVTWGVIFHILFAIFIFRVIFKRISILQTTSEKMSAGDLSVRAYWKQSKRDDELDELGLAFNAMAVNIEDKVVTISQLNQEIQQELSIGKDVQELFLGDTSIYEDYQLALFYRPLREVSGDVYKFYQLRNGLRGLFFADASGHGVSAALITTIVILSLDEIIKTAVHPGKIFTRLNDMLAIRLDTSYFATGVFFLMDSADNIYFCNAGHNPVICIRPSTGETLELDKMGPPLGLMEDYDFDTKKLAVKSGDKVLIYSDGLVETPNEAEEQYTLERSVSLLKEHATKSSKEITEIIQKDFTDFAYHYKDDVTIMVVEIP